MLLTVAGAMEQDEGRLAGDIGWYQVGIDLSMMQLNLDADMK